MRIALIRAGMGGRGGRSYRSLACLEPSALAILASLTPPEDEVHAFDDRFVELPLDQHWDLVALSAGTFEARRAYEIARMFRARGVRVVQGGYHATLVPDEAAAHVDAVAQGEAEGVWPAIVRDARQGRLRRRYGRVPPPAALGVVPRHRLLRGKGYAPISVIQYGTGCPYACEFCCIKAFYRRAIRHRPLAEVVAEIERAGRRWVFFADDNLVGDRDRARALLGAIAPLGLRWTSQVSLDVADDRELLRLLVKSGCQSLIIGLESLSQRNLQQMGKGWASRAGYEEKLAILRDHGLMIYATFVFGYDADTAQDIDRTRDWALGQRFFLANFNQLQPYPGTRLHRRLAREGRLVYDRWWLDPRYSFGEAVFQPRSMTAAELTRGTARARRAFHGVPQTLRRSLDPRANLRSPANALTFWLCNLASRQDIQRKQGLHLGTAEAPPPSSAPVRDPGTPAPPRASPRGRRGSPHPMRITFIKPNMGLVAGDPYLDHGRMEPLTFAVLQGLTPPGYDTVLYDDRYEAIPFDEETDLVAINTEIYTARRAYEIADRYRARGVKVVLGGIHTTMLPAESLAHADAVVIGDAEPVWAQVLSDARRGCLRPRYAGARAAHAALDRVVNDWSIFAGKSYLPVRLTQYTRGCPNRCEFCAVGNVYQRHHHCRPAGRVARELAEDGARFVFFVDDNIVADKPAAVELFRALIPLKIGWFSQADISFATDPALMQLMLESGCKGLVVGFESLDRENLRQMDKNVNLALEGYDSLVERIHGAGLQIWAAFVLGYDNETVASVRQTCDWAIAKKFAFSAFNILMPYPNTPFYRRMQQAGRLRYDGKWWLHDDYRFGMPGFAPKHCTAEELAGACLAARMRHSSPRSIAARALDRRTHLKDLASFMTFLSYNPLFKDEMVKKHGMRLGYRGREHEDAFLATRLYRYARRVPFVGARLGAADLSPHHQVLQALRAHFAYHR